MKLALAVGAALSLALSAQGASAPLHVPARVQGGRLAVLRDGAYHVRFWAGVNLGSTLPGRLPGVLRKAFATAR